MPPDPHDARTLLPSDEAAAHVRRVARTLARWRREGRGPDYVKLDSGQILYSVRALDDYVARCTRSPKRRAS